MGKFRRRQETFASRPFGWTKIEETGDSGVCLSGKRQMLAPDVVYARLEQVETDGDAQTVESRS